MANNSISDVEEFNDGEQPAKKSEEVREEEEPTEEEEEPVEESEEEEKPAPSAPQSRLYTFNGRQMTADELYADAILLQAEFTRRNQDKKEPEKQSGKFKPEQLEQFKEIAREAGFVSKEELNKHSDEFKEQQILTDFYKNHPEYKDQIKSRELFRELSRYNTSLIYLADNLEEAHKRLNPADPKIEEAKVKAKVEISRRQGAGSNAGAGVKTPKSSDHDPRAVEIAKKMGVWDE